MAKKTDRATENVESKYQKTSHITNKIAILLISTII